MAFLRVVVLLLMFGLFGGLNYYLYRRLVYDVTGSARLRRYGAGVIVAQLALMPLSRLAPLGHPLARVAQIAVLSFWGLSLFTLIALGAVEAVRALSRLGRGNDEPVPRAHGAPTPADRPSQLETLVAHAAASLNPRVSEVALDAEGATLSSTFERTVEEDVHGASAVAVDEHLLSRRRFVARATAAGALAFGGGLSIFGAWRAFSPPQLTEFALRVPRLPKALEGFKIVQLSDLHIGPILQERFVDGLVSVVNATKPDLVAITGDLVDGTPDQLRRYVARLSGLQSRHGTYFVSGNHDYYSGWERWAPELERVGLTVLRNRFVHIGDASASFNLVGVDDWGSKLGHNGYDLEKATAERDPQRASVLLAHQPNGLELAAAKHIGLQLSGHTHGGQLFPGTLVGEVLWGERNAGLCAYQGTLLYTNRGCGFVGPPMRVGAPPEVAEITLLAA